MPSSHARNSSFLSSWQGAYMLVRVQHEPHLVDWKQLRGHIHSERALLQKIEMRPRQLVILLMVNKQNNQIWLGRFSDEGNVYNFFLDFLKTDHRTTTLINLILDMQPFIWRIDASYVPVKYFPSLLGHCEQIEGVGCTRVHSNDLRGTRPRQQHIQTADNHHSHIDL